MDKATRSTLVTTALLGVLLYAVLRLVADLQEPPPAAEVAEDLTVVVADPGEPAPAGPAVDPDPPDPDLPRIDSHAALVAFLDARGFNGRLLVDRAANWYAERGFLGVRELFGVTPDNAPAAYYDTFDDATLKAMSEGGDAGATQTLARATMFMNPIDAFELYQRAIGQGSVYAVIKVADTLSLFADARRPGNAADRELTRRLQELQSTRGGKNLHAEAYATMLAAIGDGGPPILDADTLDWVAWLENRAPRRDLIDACRRSADILLANSIVRRDNGVTPVSMRPPPVFLNPPDRQARMPCATTDYPVVSMMNLDGCDIERVIDDAGEESDLYICDR